MLTIPIESAHPSRSALSTSTASVLVIGRSEKVLGDTVDLLRNSGRAAGASNDFENVLTQFDVANLDVVVFGGMIPPETREALRVDLAAANPTITFIQGMAGIPGLIAAQVRAALDQSGRHEGSTNYDAATRTVTISLHGSENVRLVAFWHTAFVPPDPESTFEVIFDDTMDAGTHTMQLPAHIPTVASFVVVHIGTDVHPFVAGAMPPGTTMARPPARVSGGRDSSPTMD